MAIVTSRSILGKVSRSRGQFVQPETRFAPDPEESEILRLTVIGRSPAWQDAGGACSGYLLESESVKILVDCGSGVFAKLRERVDYRDLDAIVISHRHGDHILDLLPYAYAITYATPGAVGRLPLYVPHGTAEVLRTIAGSFDRESLIDEAFDVSDYDPDRGLSIGNVEIAMREVPHFVTTYALSFTAPGAGRLVYGADCGPSDALAEFAGGADVLIAEATLPPGYDGPDAEMALTGHMGAEHAAAIAAKAGVGRLVLTHASDLGDFDGRVELAARTFDGPVEMAREGSSWQF